ncbi:ArnT family glycosyltransferase [Acidicapsa dinghuensis]|uniref:ArnT family glycosyltransferase n=1 Tax=Acidicapsa dinghuensis TaxID=2218256 RepID=A0ABW1ED75_9BACT|nr:glycosyltransferase family 39 protein [Acidicapsa dinghuensis]
MPPPAQVAAAPNNSDVLGSRITLAIAVAIALLHIITNTRYGLHRDEFQFLADARHLDWGFVAYPPFTSAIERLSMAIFGLWLPGLRLFSVLAQATAIVIAGAMARDLGGRTTAQALTAFAVALSPLPLFEGTEFQYSSFDYLWWVLASWALIRLLRDENPRWWLLIGASLGFGLETKYSILFYIAGLIGAMLLTSARRWFFNRWFWAGVALTLLIVLPNAIWQLQHNFISYRFLQHIHARDVRIGRTGGFFHDQLIICFNLAAVPIALVGLFSTFRSRTYRPIAWLFVLTLALFAIAKGRGYYTAPLYPMLLAAGAAAWERWLAPRHAILRRSLATLAFASIAAIGAYACAILVPLADSGPLRSFALARNGDLREETGWDIMLHSIAQVRDSLSPDQQAHLGLVLGNYGEAGAVEILGPQYHLPPPIAGTNSFWLRSYPSSQPTTNIVLGVGDDDREAQFTGCRLAAHVPYPPGQNNEESNDHAEIYLCGPPRLPWPELWKIALGFG